MRKQFCGNASRALYEYYGARTQRGCGLGSILCGLFRRALPFLASGAKILGQQAMNVASDIIDGKSFQDSANSRFKEGIKTFVTSNPIIPQSGSGVRRQRRLPGSRVKIQRRGRLQIFLYSMAFIHDHSCDCAKTELDVSLVPPGHTSIEYGNYVEYDLLNSIIDSGPIEFDVSSSWLNYLDFANTPPLVKAKITRRPLSVIDTPIDLFLCYELTDAQFD